MNKVLAAAYFMEEVFDKNTSSTEVQGEGYAVKTGLYRIRGGLRISIYSVHYTLPYTLLTICNCQHVC